MTVQGLKLHQGKVVCFSVGRKNSFRHRVAWRFPPILWARWVKWWKHFCSFLAFIYNDFCDVPACQESCSPALAGANDSRDVAGAEQPWEALIHRQGWRLTVPPWG